MDLPEPLQVLLDKLIEVDDREQALLEELESIRREKYNLVGYAYGQVAKIDWSKVDQTALFKVIRLAELVTTLTDLVLTEAYTRRPMDVKLFDSVLKEIRQVMGEVQRVM
jgi:hypothetical protein